MYDMDYAERIAAIRGWLDGLDNLQQVGRNGLHRYNNSDHSMLTAMRAVDNLVKGTDHDIWAVNAESAYHEEETQDEQQPYIEAPETEAQKERRRVAYGVGSSCRLGGHHANRGGDPRRYHSELDP